MQVCPGSGKPTRTDGSCDRCMASTVRGPYRETEVAKNIHLYMGRIEGGKYIPPERFVVMFSMGYYEAVEHTEVR